MIIIDGAKGEGGGQVLRTALSLSACTGQPFKIKNIRGGRKKPGLLRQHLTCVKAAAEICGGKATGADLASTELTFTPGDIRSGDYRFDIGTAGATGLVFQTVVPILLQADGPSSVQFGGGTHAKAAPPYEFLTESFLPVLRLMGADVRTDLARRGFYPAGGGQWTTFIEPLETPQAISLEKAVAPTLSAEAAVANLSSSISERELATVKEELGLEDAALHQRTYEAFGPGNILFVRAELAGRTEVFVGFGEHGVSAERVARRACRQVKKFMSAEVSVSEFLADQLLLPLAGGAGGSFTTTSPSLHFKTNAEIIKTFLDVEITVEEQDRDQFLVCVDH
ncbi:MAG: RNA 3'-terminal phosphate cyclase [Pseudomonadota bacterium]